DLDALAEPDRQRCPARLGEVFNCLAPAPGVTRVDVPEGVRLGVFNRELDRLAAGLPLEVHVRGKCLGQGGEPPAERVAELYTLCFAHPAVGGIYWEG